MLGFVKNMFNKIESGESETLSSGEKATAKRIAAITQLRPGCSLRFGFMPVADLSRKTFTVTDFNTYVFDKIQFTSFVLTDAEERSVCLIVGEDEGVRYLVLSRRLSAEDIRELLDFKPLQKVAHASLGTPLVLEARHLELGQGWLRTHYTSQVLGMKGQFYRHGIGVRDGSASRQDAVEIDYSLFVSDDEECALEIERHDNETQMFATLYRPLSDVVDITPPDESSKQVPLPLPPAEEVDMPSVVQDNHLPHLPPLADAPVPEFYVAAPTPESPPEIESLEFDIKIAAKLIEEAKKSKIPLAELVRKVVDLPKSVPETIEIHFPLNHEDYRVLAERYHLDPSDREQIRQCIHRELLHFTGEV